MKCLLRHDWVLLRTDPYRDVSFGEPGLARSCLYFLCRRCGKPRTSHVDGTWTLADFRWRSHTDARPEQEEQR